MTPYDTNVVSPLVANKRIRRIGLVSPWSGGNLGNEVILSAMISNIRKRIIGAEVLGITLSDHATRSRLGVPGFPLVGMSQRYYSRDSGVSDTSDTTEQKYGPTGRLKTLLKRIPGLWGLLRSVRYSKPGVELAHVLSAVRVVRDLDLIVICGGGAIDDFWGGAFGHPWSLLKWGVLSRLNKVSFLFVSVGASQLQRGLSRVFVGIALRLAEYRSYRDHESLETVKALMENPKDSVYPDLAFSYPLSALSATIHLGSERDRQLTVGVSPIAYCDPRVWPHSDESLYTAYVDKMTEFVSWLLAEDHRVLFFATDTPDMWTVADILARLAHKGVSCSRIEALPGPTEQNAGDTLKGMCHADLIVASRLHGVIMSHLNGIPALAIPCEPKVYAHMKRIGQVDYCFDIDTFTNADLVTAFRALEENRQEVRSRICSEHLRFRQLLDVQYDEIFGPPQDSGTR